MAVTTSMVGSTMIVCVERPPVNALDLDAIDELQQAFQAVEREMPKGGVVLTGSGQTFSAGVDTRAFTAYDRQQRRAMVLAITRMTARLLAISTPVVAAVNGHALGGGFVLMLGCDYRLASDVATSKLGMAESQAGIPFPAGPLEIMRAELSPELLRRLTLTSAVLGVHELRQAGVLDELHAPDDLVSTATDRAVRLAQQPAFIRVKKQIRGALANRLSALAATGEDAFIESFD
jgi:enoyl-CoA hydratase